MRVSHRGTSAFVDGSNRGDLKWFLLRGQEADGAEGGEGGAFKYLSCVNAHFSPHLSISIYFTHLCESLGRHH